MNTEELQKIFLEQPEHIQNFFVSGELQKEIIHLENTYNLQEAESRVIQEQCIGFLLGLINKDDSIMEIVLALRTREDIEVNTIIQEIEDSILAQKV